MIYKGPSIYKFGGGGGFKNGGQLVDGDFIKVENNTISSYDNVSRDPLNFLLEVKDGEVLNSVVELTTAVNATVNVYVVKNGFYYLLGNVGGNTVNAGEQYNLNVVGDSFALDQVTVTNTDPEYIELENSLYKLKKVGSIYWALEDWRGGSQFNRLSHDSAYGLHYYYKQTDYQAIDAYLRTLGARLPSKNEYYDQMVSFVGSNSTDNVKKIKSIDMWNTNEYGIVSGTNELELNFKPFGGYPWPYGNYNTAGWRLNFYGIMSDGRILDIRNTLGIQNTVTLLTHYSVRFVVDA